MDQDRFLQLLIKKKFNSETLEDVAELKEYLKRIGYNFSNYSDLIDFPGFNITTSNLSEEDLENKWESFNERILSI